MFFITMQTSLIMYRRFLLVLLLAVNGLMASAQSAAGARLSHTFTGELHVTPAFKIPLTETAHLISFTLSCFGPATDGTFELRFSSDLKDWSDWLPMQDDAHADVVSGRRNFEMVLFLADVQYVQLRASGLSAALTASLRFYSPTGIPDAAAKGPAPYASSCPCPLPSYVDRAGWGGPATQQSGCTPSYTPVSHLIVHHQAGTANPPYAAVVNAIWQQHVYSNGWCDVGYNWLIAPDGTIFEGRAGGNNVFGAHFCGKNANTMGVCFLGNFENQQPTAQALASLASLLAWKCCDSQISPVGSSLHNSSGLMLAHISGHRDGCSTLCPGENLYAKLPFVRVNTDTLYRDPTGCDGLWPPPNDDCDQATILFSAESCQAVSSTTNDATPSGVPIPTCNGFTSSTALDVWFRFGTVEDHHQVTVTPTGNLPGALDPVIALYDGSCGTLQLVACVDVPGGAGVATTLDLPDLIPGHIYYIRVYDYGNEPATDGRFDICVKHGSAVSTGEVAATGGLALFPNPTTGVVTVRLPDHSPAGETIRVFDLSGRLVFHRKMTANTTAIDLLGTPAGAYVVLVEHKNGVYRQLLVVE